MRRGIKVTLWIVGGAALGTITLAALLGLWRGMQATVFAPTTTKALAERCHDEVPGWDEHVTVTVASIVADEPPEVFEVEGRADDVGSCVMDTIGADESALEESVTAHPWDEDPTWEYETNGWVITMTPSPDRIRSTFTPTSE